MPLPNLKKVAKTKRGITAIVIAAAYVIVNGINILGWFETAATIKPLLNHVSVVSEYSDAIGVWVGAHFGAIVVGLFCIGLFTWAARDVAEQEREDPPANLILSFTTIRQVAIGGPPYNWEIATIESPNPQVGLVARFANRAKTFPVGIAHDVRADIIFENADGNKVASHPAPWLFRSSPVVSFEVGAQNELLVALDVLYLPQFPAPASMAEGQRPQRALRTIEDVADREPDAAARYSYHRGLFGVVNAKIYLTVNGLAMPYFEVTLRPSDPSVTPNVPPSIESVVKLTWWRKLRNLC